MLIRQTIFPRIKSARFYFFLEKQPLSLRTPFHFPRAFIRSVFFLSHVSHCWSFVPKRTKKQELRNNNVDTYMCPSIKKNFLSRERVSFVPTEFVLCPQCLSIPPLFHLVPPFVGKIKDCTKRASSWGLDGSEKFMTLYSHINGPIS